MFLNSQSAVATASHGVIFLCAAVAFYASSASAAAPRSQQSRDVVEVVPTARQQPAEWRYSFDHPAGDECSA